MSETGGNGPRPRRSGSGFPAMPLTEAAMAVKKAGAYGYQHSVDALAFYMNHSTTNSGAFRAKAAALRDYGLISGRGEVITLTDLAQTIAHPDSVAAEQEALRAAFFHAELFARLHDTVAKGIELDVDHLGNAAVRTLGVSATSKAAFIESFVAGAVAGGVAERVDEQRVTLLPRDAAVRSSDEDVQSDERVAAAAPGPTTTDGGRTAEAPRAPAVVPTVHQQWDVPGGSVTFEIAYDRPLPALVFAQVAEVVNQCERLTEILESLTAGDRPSGRSSEQPPALEYGEGLTGG